MIIGRRRIVVFARSFATIGVRRPNARSWTAEPALCFMSDRASSKWCKGWTMNISSRRPEGRSGHCPVCGAHICMEPSCPPGDAPCPACGCLMWFTCSSTDLQLWDSRNTRSDSRPLEILSGATVCATTRDVALQCYQLFAACLFATASLTVLAAALADSCWHARDVSEMVGLPGRYLLGVSLFCLVQSGRLDNRQQTHTTSRQADDAGFGPERTSKRALFGWSTKDTIQSSDSAISDHPMRDRLLDG
jgi:hypothetical protein